MWDSASQISSELLIQYVFPLSGFSEDLLTYRQGELFLTQILNAVASITNMNSFRKRNPTFGVARIRDLGTKLTKVTKSLVPSSQYYWAAVEIQSLSQPDEGSSFRWKNLDETLIKQQQTPQLRAACLRMQSNCLLITLSVYLKSKSMHCSTLHWSAIEKSKHETQRQSMWLEYISLSVTENALAVIGKPSVRIF